MLLGRHAPWALALRPQAGHGPHHDHAQHGKAVNHHRQRRTAARQVLDVGFAVGVVSNHRGEGKQQDGIQPIVSHLYRAVSESFIMPLMRHCFNLNPKVFPLSWEDYLETVEQALIHED